MNDSGRSVELDGLRGVSIAMVLLLHYVVHTVDADPGTVLAYVLKYCSLAFAGVDIFFVLSGFLLGGILMDQRGSANLFRIFYLRRALRILPSYVLLLLLFVLALRFLPAATPTWSWLLADPFPAASYMFYMQNFLMAAEGRLGPNFMGITWSLAIEEQFYLLFPLLIYFCPSRYLGRVLVLLIFLAPVLRTVLLVTLQTGDWAGFVLLPSRWDSLLAGVLAAWFLRKHGAISWIDGHARRLGCIALFLTLGIAAFPFLRWWERTLGMAAIGHLWIAATVAVLLLLIATGHSGVLGRWLTLRPLRYLGRISYSIYLFHQAVHGMVFAIARDGDIRISSMQDFALIILALAVTLALASVLWYAYEARMINFGHRYLYRRAEQAH